MTQIKSEKALTYMTSPESCDTGAIGMVHAVSLAETEAEERHAAELQALKDKAVEAFCYSMNIGFACKKDCPAGKCAGFNNFTQKLNEK